MYICPKGFDSLQGSPTFGNPLQLGYALNSVTGGPAGMPLVQITNGNGTSQVMYLWEHCRSFGCSYNGLPWPLNDSDWINHYPENRHAGVFGVQFCDGHVITDQPRRKSSTRCITRPRNSRIKDTGSRSET